MITQATITQAMFSNSQELLQELNIIQNIIITQNTIYYSGLIGYFYQHGSGREIDKVNKALGIFSRFANKIKSESSQCSFDQKMEVIVIIVIKISKHNYNKTFVWYSKSSGENIRAMYNWVIVMNMDVKRILKDESKTFKWYSKATSKEHAYSQYLVTNYYNYGNMFQKKKRNGFIGTI
ncbi:hypothetical protein C1645_814092 [Glomus cerebriforme]|uniref:Uncharacterized protein n=1 Tax=Glomus cerebriforme TaxID=658196 RepID=A0A397TGL7_9GLOM|nr:hypothetical protein C1645_814092 [Glomus cerebriforme]